MEITEKHLQKIYNKLVRMNMVNEKMSDEAYEYFNSGIGLFKLELELILKAKSEEDLKESEEFAEIAIEIFNNDNMSTDEKVEKIVAMANEEKKIKCQKS